MDKKHLTYNFQEDESECWSMSDLQVRYGCGRQKITGDFFGYGIPRYKSGNAWCFPKDKVKEWEICTKYIPFGRKGKIELPEFIYYRTWLLNELSKAKKEKDKARVDEIKENMRFHGISNNNYTVVLTIIFILLVFFSVFSILREQTDMVQSRLSYMRLFI